MRGCLWFILRTSRATRRLFFGAAPVLSVVVFLSAGAHASDETDTRFSDVALGKVLFTHVWSPGDPRSRSGDGLGPMFNERSCVACHSQGGIGGGGATNVHVIRVAAPELPFANFAPPQLDHQRAAEVHPLLKFERSVVLHRHSTLDDYEPWRKERYDRSTSARVRSCAMPTIPKTAGVDAEALRSNFDRAVIQLQQSVESSPIQNRATEIEELNPMPLFGLGLIDAISDRVLEKAATERLRFPGAQGRLARLPTGGIGRFGWRAQEAGLHDFTLDACATELGLEVPGRMQAADPRQARYRAVGLDLSKDDCDHLTAFIRSLPRPQKLSWAAAKPAVREGKRLFVRVGCADCHRPNLGGVQEIYSDLLLHDMGNFSGGGSYGSVLRSVAAQKEKAQKKGKVVVTEVAETEWRTPPLWGCRDSAPYMHDGTAPTIASAILQHEGQASASVREYRKLGKAKQQKLIAFLSSLAAPLPEAGEAAAPLAAVAKSD